MTETRDTRANGHRASDEGAETGTVTPNDRTATVAGRPNERTGPDAGTLGDVDHTHPDTGRTFGGHFTFARGGVIAADGGRPDVVPEDGDDEASATLKDVDHTPPNESENANRVFERGEEAREEDGTEAKDFTADVDEDVGEDE